jgi:hypothetical protein
MNDAELQKTKKDFCLRGYHIKDILYFYKRQKTGMTTSRIETTSELIGRNWNN